MKRIVTLYIAIICATLTWGQGVKFTATTSANPVTVDETFQIEFKVNAAGSKFKAPALSKHFRVYSGPNKGTSMHYVNGKMSSSVSYSYMLVPINKGTVKLEPASIEVNGKVYKSNSLTIQINDISESKKKQAKDKKKSLEKQVKKNLFIKLNVSKNKVYKGEQFVATYKLYNRTQLTNIEPEKLPDLKGFYQHEIEIDQRTNLKKEVINGVMFDVYTLKQMILLPQRSGKLELVPMQLNATIRVREEEAINTWFGPQYRYSNKEVKLTSNGATIDVKALPAGQPSSFSGAVGNFSMKASIDKQQVKVNEGINLSIKIAGTGNINLAEIPEPVAPTDFDVWDPKIKTNIGKKSAVLSGSKSAEYLMIPRHSGDFAIPSLKFSYFDPVQEKYVTLSSETYNLLVEKDANAPEESSAHVVRSKKEVERLGSDIRFIKVKQANLITQGEFFFMSVWYWFWLIFGLLILVVVFVMKWRYSHIQSDVVGKRIRKANKLASKHLKEAKIYLDAGDNHALYDSISKAIFGYVGDKLNISVSELSQHNIEDKLKEKEVDHELVKVLKQLLDDCNMARFAPSANSSPASLYERAEQIIQQLESALK